MPERPYSHVYGNYAYDNPSYMQETPFRAPDYNNVPNHQTPFDYFSKPKQPMNWHPYAPFTSKPKSSNLFHYFQDDKGEIELDQMLSTVGQVANTIQQVSPVIKQVSSIMKQFK